MLDVEVFRQAVAGNARRRSIVRWREQPGRARPPEDVWVEDQDELSSLLQLPVVAGTVNRGSDVIGGGMVVNDWCAFTGLDTTATELQVIEHRRTPGRLAAGPSACLTCGTRSSTSSRGRPRWEAELSPTSFLLVAVSAAAAPPPSNTSRSSSAGWTSARRCSPHATRWHASCAAPAACASAAASAKGWPACGSRRRSATGTPTLR